MTFQQLTEEARKGRLPPLQARLRQQQLRQLMGHLERKWLSCVLLVGDPGVGKRALVQLLAIDLIRANCPSQQMKGMPVILADPDELLPNEGKQKFLQNRLYTLGLSGAGHAFPIVCIAEAHRLIQRGIVSGELADWLIAPGNKWILTLPTEEYHKYFSPQKKWSGREFAVVEVPELSEEQTLEVITGRQRWFCCNYDVSIEWSAANDAVKLCKTYLSERRRPGIVLEVLEEACKQVKQLEDGNKTVTRVDIARTVGERAGVCIPAEEQEEALEPSAEAKAAGEDEPLAEAETAPGRQSVPTAETAATSVESPPAIGKPIEDSVVAEAPSEEALLSERLLHRLIDFVHELDRQTLELSRRGEESIQQQLGSALMEEVDPTMLDDMLNSLLGRLQRLEHAPSLQAREQQQLLEDCRDFIQRTNQRVLKEIGMHARSILDDPGRLPNQRPLHRVWPEDQQEEADPVMVRRYLESLYRWVDLLLFLLNGSTGEMFEWMRKRLEPTPSLTLERYRQVYNTEMDQIELLGKWKKIIEGHLRATCAAEKRQRR